ncbi:MAG: hypothetical protein SNH27_07395 [Rikenellaceae bacterium]
MVQITADQYATIAREIREKSDAAGYFNGRFDFENSDDTITIGFDGVVYLYYHSSLEEWGWEHSVVDAASIWTECHTTAEDGEVLNDFQFKDLLPYLLD